MQKSVDTEALQKVAQKEFFPIVFLQKIYFGNKTYLLLILCQAEEFGN